MSRRPARPSGSNRDQCLSEPARAFVLVGLIEQVNPAAFHNFAVFTILFGANDYAARRSFFTSLQMDELSLWSSFDRRVPKGMNVGRPPKSIFQINRTARLSNCCVVCRFIRHIEIEFALWALTAKDRLKM